ncbi:MAG TPA: glucokinase [Vicinamibacterales bacterium]
MLLAGDLGGTKTLLGLFRKTADPRPEHVLTLEFTTRDYPTATALLAEFFEKSGIPARDIEAACLGFPGPVIEQRVRLTNVPWFVDARELTDALGLRNVWLLNDLAAMAHVVTVLRDDELLVLQQGRRDPNGNGALVAAGTGLGQAMLINVDGVWRVSPSEGGHADFAARTPREIELVQELIRQYGRAYVELIACGPGLVRLCRFTSGGRSFVFQETDDETELPALISRAALERKCPYCVEALEMWVSALGAATGNFAMHCMASGGVFVGGGIPPKILPAFRTPTFITAFNAKQPMDDLMRDMPVSLILNSRSGLLGAAVYANRM